MIWDDGILWRSPRYLCREVSQGLEFSNGEGEAHVHARGIVLYRGVQELLHLGERHNFVEFALDIAAGHA